MLFAIYPVIYIYMESFISRGTKIVIQPYYFIVPTIVFITTIIFFIVLESDEFFLLIRSMNSYRAEPPQEYALYIWILYIIYYLQFVFFVRLYIVLYRRLKNNKKVAFASNWIKYIIYVVFLYEVIFFFTWLIHDDILFADVLLGNLLIIFFGIIGIKHDEILLGMQITSSLQNNEIIKSARKIKSKFKTESQKEIVKRIKEIIISEKLYANPNLHIKSFAKRLHLPEKQLSILINDVLEKNFSAFVNEFRIEEACRLLSEKDLKITEIPPMIGFYSRSAFNTAFKEATGLTPSEYRSQIDLY